MRAVIQRVSEAQVSVQVSVNAALPGQARGKLAGQTRREIVGQIRQGLVVLLGVTADDTLAEAEYLSEKIVRLRIFSDAAGKFAHSVQDIQGELLVVSQFTLYADTRKGRRPSFTAAAGADKAKPLYEYFVTCCKRQQIPVATGQFQASMAVQLINDGPVTLILDTAERRTKGNG